MTEHDSNTIDNSDPLSKVADQRVSDTGKSSSATEEEGADWDALFVPLAAKFRWWHVLVAITLFALLIWTFPAQPSSLKIGVYSILFVAIGFYVFNARYPTTAKKNQFFANGFLLLLATTAFKIVSPESNVPMYISGSSFPRPDVAETRRRLSPALKIGKRQPTVDYWTQTVADLHTRRFQFADGTEPSPQFYQRFIEQMQQNLDQVRSVAMYDVDSDLREMVNQHLDLDQRSIDLLSRVRNLSANADADEPAAIDVTKEPATIGETIEQGWQLYEQITTDPAYLDQIEDPEVRGLLLQLMNLDEARLEQFREIELMQVRLQERYYPASFALPVVR